MHLNFDFSARQILWTLTFAAQLVLLVVLLGRDRQLQLMAEVLLAGRLAVLPLQIILLALADLISIVSLLVLVELARKAFASAGRLSWINGSMTVLLLSGAATASLLWRYFQQHWEQAGQNSLLGHLYLMNFVHMAGDVMSWMLAIVLSGLVLLFGRRHLAAWSSHTQRILIGLSTVGLASLSKQLIVLFVARSVVVHTQSEANHLRELFQRLDYANIVVSLCALVWWIACLWQDEGASTAGTHDVTAQPTLQADGE